MPSPVKRVKWGRYPPFTPFMQDWCNGNIGVSKTFAVSSILTSCASTVDKIRNNCYTEYINVELLGCTV